MKGSEQEQQEMLTLRLREKQERRVCPCAVCSILNLIQKSSCLARAGPKSSPVKA